MDTPTIHEHDLAGFKYLKTIFPLLQRLHRHGCERDQGQKRLLHYDQYAALVLLYFFNPIVTSLRGLQHTTELGKVQRALGGSRTSLGALSEAATVFDAALLTGIIDELGAQLQPLQSDPHLHDITRTITLVDGTLLPALPKIVQAVWIDEHPKAFKLHFHFELLKGVPVRADLTDGTDDERDVLAGVLEAGRLYVLDRGYAKFTLLHTIMLAQSSFVCRVRNNSVFAVTDVHALDAEAQHMGSVRDQVGRLGCKSKQDELPARIRLVQVDVDPRTQPHARGLEPYTMLIATDLLEVSATVIALLYRYRWQVELFFRFFKHVLNCRHLLSHHTNGITIQVYVAIIACLLITLWTGRKATRRTYEILCHAFAGWATEAEVEAHLAKLQRLDGGVQERGP
jgi:Transposase DDE domain